MLTTPAPLAHSKPFHGTPEQRQEIDPEWGPNAKKEKEFLWVVLDTQRSPGLHPAGTQGDHVISGVRPRLLGAPQPGKFSCSLVLNYGTSRADGLRAPWQEGGKALVGTN